MAKPHLKPHPWADSVSVFAENPRHVDAREADCDESDRASIWMDGVMQRGYRGWFGRIVRSAEAR